MIKVFEAFAGIGTQRMALRNLGIEHEVVAIAEIDKYAILSYEAIHGEVNNLGDISKINTEDIPDHDLFTYSFPCQDISVAGQQKGLDKGSDTRSGLLWECEKVIRVKRPKYLLMENVKNLVGKKHKSNFDKWLVLLEELGYTNYWQVLNAKDYGIPQNRERVFCISILNDTQGYEFPKPFELDIRLKDLLEDEVDEKFYLSQEQVDKIKFSKFEQNKRRIQEKDYSDSLCARDYKDPKCVKVNQIGQYDTPTRTNSSRFRVYDEESLSPSLTTMGGGNLEPHVIGGVGDKNFGKQWRQGNRIYNADTIATALMSSPVGNAGGQTNLYGSLKQSNFRIRKLTPLECWRLMGISDEDYYKAQKVNSNTQLYKQAGNAIVVDVLQAIFKNLFGVRK